VARVYYYAMRRKMEQDIKTERTFTSLADKTYFLCELAWEMLSLDRLTLNFREFPDRLRSMFGLQDKDIDHWCYDMMGNSLLIRDGGGNYKFAHKSLVEFFVAYKFAAELGLLHRDFWGLMVEMGMGDARTWSEYCGALACPEERERFGGGEFVGFQQEPEERLVNTFGKMLLTKVVIDLLLPLLNIEIRYRESNMLLALMQWTRGKSDKAVGWLGSNAGNLLLQMNSGGLSYQNLAETILPNIDLRDVSLVGVDLTGANLCNALVSGYFGMCTTIATSADNKWFATGHDDGTIRTWNTDDGRERSIFRCKHGVDAIVVSNDGRWLFSSGRDSTIDKWNVNTGECVHSSIMYQGYIRTLALSIDNQWLFSGHDDNTVRKWDMESGDYILSYSGHQQPVKSLAVSSDNRWIFSSGYDNTVKKWSIESGDCIFSCSGHQDLVTSLVISSDNQWIFSSSYDNTVRKWSVKTGECHASFFLHDNPVEALALSIDGRWLFTGDKENSIRKWNTETGKCNISFSGHEDWITVLALSPDNLWLFSGSGDNTVRKWDVETGKYIFSFSGHKSHKQTVYITEGIGIVEVSYENSVKKRDEKTGEWVTYDKSPCAGTKIHGIQGLTDAQRQSLIALGAIP
jgi:WD40 repeat protein